MLRVVGVFFFVATFLALVVDLIFLEVGILDIVWRHAEDLGH